MSDERVREGVYMQGRDERMGLMPREQREQRQKKVEENRRMDKKALGKFAVILIMSTLVGGVCGALSVVFEGGVKMLGSALTDGMRILAPYASLVLTTAALLGVSVLTGQARRLYAAWDGEDEELINRVELKLTYGLVITSVTMILSYLFFAVAVYVTGVGELNERINQIRMAATLAGLIYTMVVLVILEKRIVNFTKEINPEKKGSVYDTKFRSNWLDSCDESERQQIYQAGYQAWTAGNYTCMGLWVFGVIGMMAWDFGILPIIMVVIVWLVMSVRYQVECIRMSKRGA